MNLIKPSPIDGHVHRSVNHSTAVVDRQPTAKRVVYQLLRAGGKIRPNLIAFCEKRRCIPFLVGARRLSCLRSPVPDEAGSAKALVSVDLYAAYGNVGNLPVEESQHLGQFAVDFVGGHDHRVGFLAQMGENGIPKRIGVVLSQNLRAVVLPESVLQQALVPQASKGGVVDKLRDHKAVNLRVHRALDLDENRQPAIIDEQHVEPHRSAVIGGFPQAYFAANKEKPPPGGNVLGAVKFVEK